MRLRVIDQGYVSPVQSQAVWHGVATTMRGDSDAALTLLNPLDPYICVGFHQDVGLEVDEEFCRARGVAVLRRRLGGGAVLLDHHQMIFHFVVPRAQAPSQARDLYPRFIEPVMRTYRTLGIAATYRPLNDIHVDGRKIGGTAAAILDEATVLGGMFLFDFDSATMARCLKVPSQKFRDKLAISLEDYVTSMRRLLPAVPSRDEVKTIFLHHVADCLDVVPIAAELTPAEAAAAADEVQALSRPEWHARVGRRFVPQGVKLAAGTYLTEGGHKAPGGLIRARVLARDDRIVDLELSGDFTCMPDGGVAALAARLTGVALAGEPLAEAVAGTLAELKLDLPGVAAADLVAAILAGRHSEK